MTAEVAELNKKKSSLEDDIKKLEEQRQKLQKELREMSDNPTSTSPEPQPQKEPTNKNPIKGLFPDEIALETKVNPTDYPPTPYRP